MPKLSRNKLSSMRSDTQMTSNVIAYQSSRVRLGGDRVADGALPATPTSASDLSSKLEAVFTFLTSLLLLADDISDATRLGILSKTNSKQLTTQLEAPLQLVAPSKPSWLRTRVFENERPPHTQVPQLTAPLTLFPRHGEGTTKGVRLRGPLKLSLALFGPKTIQFS